MITAHTEPTDTELLKIAADRIDLCQFETDAFTSGELTLIARYMSDTLGVADGIDSPTAEGHHEFALEFGNTAALAMVRADFHALSLWWDSIDGLRQELRPVGAALSTAAFRYVGYELMAWHSARSQLQAAALAWTLGGADPNAAAYSTAMEFDGFRYVDGMFWIPA